MEYKRLIDSQNELSVKVNIVQSALDELAGYDLVEQDNHIDVLTALNAITDQWSVKYGANHNGLEIMLLSHNTWLLMCCGGEDAYYHACTVASEILEESLVSLLAELSIVENNIKTLYN